jgi:hypothetical protein
VLKETHTWVRNNASSQSDLELTWTLDFNGTGRQGRVKAKVKKVENLLTERGRRLQARSQPVPAPSMDDEEDEDDDDYEEDDDDEDEMMSESEEEEVSEFVETPRR